MDGKFDKISGPSEELTKELLAVQEMLYRSALKLTKNANDADDLLQQTNQRAVGAWEKFIIGTNMPNWTTLIMKRIFFDDQEKKKPLPASQGGPSVALAFDNLEHKPGNEHEKVDLDLLDERVMAALKALDEIDQKILLRRAAGASVEDVAQDLNIPLGTVMTKSHRALGKIRDRLGSAGKLRDMI